MEIDQSGKMNSCYQIDGEKLANVRNEKAWMENPKYFKSVKLSPSACMQMMKHGQQGVEKGTEKNGKPIEVMGLLLGRPDTNDRTSIIITDAMPLPIEGFETRVVADDENVINYMIELGDALVASRKEHFCGWYHTHPFDIDGTNHCFLSNTDLSTQLQWQRSEDNHGNPWLAIVIDPLLSLSKAEPVMSAFRVYPPEYSPPANETPDGTIVPNDKLRVQQWGACWNRYYEIPIEYFISSLAQNTLGAIKNKFLWERVFYESTKSTEVTNETTASINSVASGIEKLKPSKSGSQGQAAIFFSSSISHSDAAVGHSHGGSSSGQFPYQEAVDLGKTCQCHLNLELLKSYLFSRNRPDLKSVVTPPALQPSSSLLVARGASIDKSYMMDDVMQI